MTANPNISYNLAGLLISRQSDFQIEQLWVVSVITVYLQLLISLLLLNKQFKRSFAVWGAVNPMLQSINGCG